MKCPYYQKHIKQITFNHTTLLNLTLPIFEVFILISLDVNLSMNQTLLMFLFYKSQTWITPLSLSLWEVVLYVWFCSYVKKGLPFSQDLPSEYSGILWILFLSTDFTSFVVLLFFLYQHHLLFLHGFWCYFIYRRWDSLNQLKLMSIRRINVHQKKLTYSGGTDRSGEFCYNFSYHKQPNSSG